MNNDAIALMRRYLTGEIETVEDYILNGTPREMAEYRHALGKLEAYSRIEEKLSEIQKKLLDE